MGKLLLVLVLCVAAVAALGFYLEWFKLGTTANPETGKTEVRMTVDQNKIKGDVTAAKQKLGGAATGAEQASEGK
jgi:hypothetical protein